MTPQGKQFVEQIDKVKSLVAEGVSPYVAMSTVFENTDWLLVFASACAMAVDIRKAE